jgi:hypothetical protein
MWRQRTKLVVSSILMEQRKHLCSLKRRLAIASSPDSHSSISSFRFDTSLASSPSLPLSLLTSFLGLLCPQLIWSIISFERIVRMENITSLANDRASYEYLPVHVYNSVLERLTKISPPKYNQSLTFQVPSLLSLLSLSSPLSLWSLAL